MLRWNFGAKAIPISWGPRSQRISNITLGDRERDRGNWPQAAHHYKEALRRNPNNFPIWIQYGHALKETGQLKAAKAAYLTALALNPQDADAHVQLGHLYKLEGNLDDAQAAYMRGFALDPQHPSLADEMSVFGWNMVHARTLRQLIGRLPPDSGKRSIG